MSAARTRSDGSAQIAHALVLIKRLHPMDMGQLGTQAVVEACASARAPGPANGSITAVATEETQCCVTCLAEAAFMSGMGTRRPEPKRLCRIPALPGNAAPRHAMQQKCGANRRATRRFRARHCVCGTSTGARQATCRLIHAASGCKLRSSKCVLMMESRSGLSVTTSTGFQLRVCRDQRAGLSAWAWVYSAWRAARMA